MSHKDKDPDPRQDPSGENQKHISKYWSCSDPKTPWRLHQSVHSDLCKNDIMFRLLFDTKSDTLEGSDDVLSAHVNGLISRASEKEPGIIVNTFGEDAWSTSVLETFDFLRQLPSDPVLGNKAHRGFRRTIYHAVIFICMPHVATFAQYIAQKSLYPHKIVHFIENVLLPAETAFFIEGKDGLHTIDAWVSFLRCRWYLYVSAQ